MNLLKRFKTPLMVAIMFFSIALLSGCGLSDEQIAELKNLQAEVKTLEAEANSLKDTKAQLESEIQTINRKLAECNKQKEETKANLQKLPQ